jgi:hypothetical protein
MLKPHTGSIRLALILLAGTCGMALSAPDALARGVIGSFGFSPAAPITNEAVTFTSTATTTGTGNRLLLLAWDLDNDGAFDDGFGVTVSRAFAPAGGYTVRLRAIDRDGNEAIVAQTVNVHDPPPTPLLSPFPVVQIAGHLSRRGTRVRLSVEAPAGATVVVSCRGRGCSLRRQRRTVRIDHPSAGAATAVIRFRRLGRRVLRAGVVLKVFVTKPGSIGKYARFVMRRHRPPRRTDGCVPFGTTTPVTCPPS